MVDIKALQSKFTALRERMRVDMDMYYLEQYIFRDPATKAEIPHTDSITLNDPRTFADTVLAMLNSDKRTIEITGIDPTLQKKVEDDLELWLDENDDDLADQVIEPLAICENFLLSMRGWGGVLVIMMKDGNRYKPTLMPIDPMWSAWEVGKRGFKVVSYKVRMDRSEAEERYKRKFAQGKNDVDFEVYWDTEDHVVLPYESGVITPGTKPVLEVHHGMGICPAWIIPAPTQPMLISAYGADYGRALARQGESIYAANRDLYPKLNEIASVWATINKQQFLTPLVYMGGREFKQRPYGIGVVVELLENEKLLEIPTKEMSVSAQALFGQLLSRAQRGSMSNVNYGELSFELSALAVAQLKDDRDKIFVPRRKAKSALYRRIARMLQYQLSHQCYETELDSDEGFKIDVTPWKEKFSAKFIFNSLSPEENIANYQLAQQAKLCGRPQESIMTDILQVPHPQEEMRKAKLERVYAQCPELELFDTAIEEASGDVTEKSIKEMRSEIILWKLNQITQQGGTGLSQVPNPGSPPKQEIGINRPSSEKLARAQSERSGQATAKEGAKAKANE